MDWNDIRLFLILTKLYGVMSWRGKVGTHLTPNCIVVVDAETNAQAQALADVMVVLYQGLHCVRPYAAEQPCKLERCRDQRFRARGVMPMTFTPIWSRSRS